MYSVIAIMAVVLLNHHSVQAASRYRCPDNLNEDDSVVVDTTCYAFYDATYTWIESRDACEQIGGTLAVIRNETVQSAIFAMATGVDVDTWLGATDSGALLDTSEGDFIWIGDESAFWEGGDTGAAVNGAYSNWATNEPNNSGSTEHCMEIYRTDGKWNDQSCSDPQKYVCQINALAVGGRAAHDLRMKQLKEGPTYYDMEVPDLADVGIFLLPQSTTAQLPIKKIQHTSAPDTPEFSRRTQATQQLLMSMENEQPKPSVPAQREQINHPLRLRTCERVMKWFQENATILDRINARLKKRFDFECSE